MMSQAEFAAVARSLMAECHRLGLTVPAFRSPCRVAGAHRSIRRTRVGQVVVHVSHIGRDVHSVTADLIDGVIAANDLTDAQTVETMRNALWVAAGEAVSV